MASLSILLEVSEEEFKLITDFVDKTGTSDTEEVWKPDSLMFFLTGERDKTRKGDEPYEMLYQITQRPKERAEKEIKDYLENWYNLHKQDPWYNTHLRDKGYSGYWAWEVAAVVKGMGLDDSGLKDNPYYLYDMVHWKEIT